MTSEQSDLALVQLAQRGDPGAFDALVRRYQHKVVKLVLRYVRDPAEAEDIAQEAFIGFLNSLPNYDRRRPLESYLFSICAYKLTDHLRRQGRRRAAFAAPLGVRLLVREDAPREI